MEDFEASCFTFCFPFSRFFIFSNFWIREPEVPEEISGSRHRASGKHFFLMNKWGFEDMGGQIWKTWGNAIIRPGRLWTPSVLQYFLHLHVFASIVPTVVSASMGPWGLSGVQVGFSKLWAELLGWGYETIKRSIKSRCCWTSNFR